MRPHVELIDEADLIWHQGEFPHSTGAARQRHLAYDEEDGSLSAKVHFDTAWSRPAGVHVADTEWFVLKGQVRLGDNDAPEHVLNEGGYWMAPAGVLTPAINVDAGTEILLFREYGDWTFEPADRDRDGLRPDQVFVVVHSAQDEWIPVELGSPMRFDLGGTPVPGLFIKMLHRDAETGFYTRLIKAKPGWREHPLAHHPVYEEAYCLDGGFEYNFGKMWPGTYFFRPALVRHGDFTSAAEDGCTWIVRCDGDLVDWYTTEASIEMHGNATNWGPEYPHTLAPVLPQPVRSRTIGDMADRRYQ
jgi:quercetin dioxygenase-like cupin family protein